MTTPAKTAANRRNAKKSTGPIDTTSTRYNARKHGLLSEGVTELDNPDAFEDLRTRLVAELKPVGEIEMFLTQRIALEMLRLRRGTLLEAEYLTAQLNPPVIEQQGGWSGKAFEDIQGRTVVLDAGLPARLSADAVGSLADTFARYETMAENRLIRALNQLERMQRLRRGENLSVPATVDEAGQA